MRKERRETGRVKEMERGRKKERERGREGRGQRGKERNGDRVTMKKTKIHVYMSYIINVSKCHTCLA